MMKCFMALTTTITNKDPAFTESSTLCLAYFLFFFFFRKEMASHCCVFSLWKVSNGDIKGAVSSHPERAHIQPASSYRPVTSSQSHHILILHTLCVCVCVCVCVCDSSPWRYVSSCFFFFFWWLCAYKTSFQRRIRHWQHWCPWTVLSF